MNRREMLATISASVAGVGGTLSTIEAEPMPLVIVVTMPPPEHTNVYDCAESSWSYDPPLPQGQAHPTEWLEVDGKTWPILFVEHGTKVKALIDPRITNHHT